MKNWKITFYILAVIPWTFIVSIFAFYFHAATILGHLPRYKYPDPKELNIYEIYIIFIDKSLELTSVSLCIFIISTIIYYILNRNNSNISWNPVKLCVLGYFLVIYVLFSGIFEWIAD